MSGAGTASWVPALNFCQCFPNQRKPRPLTRPLELIQNSIDHRLKLKKKKRRRRRRIDFESGGSPAVSVSEAKGGSLGLDYWALQKPSNELSSSRHCLSVPQVTSCSKEPRGTFWDTVSFLRPVPRPVCPTAGHSHPVQALAHWLCSVNIHWVTNEGMNISSWTAWNHF